MTRNANQKLRSEQYGRESRSLTSQDEGSTILKEMAGTSLTTLLSTSAQSYPSMDNQLSAMAPPRPIAGKKYLREQSTPYFQGSKEATVDS